MRVDWALGKLRETAEANKSEASGVAQPSVVTPEGVTVEPPSNSNIFKKEIDGVRGEGSSKIKEVPKVAAFEKFEAISLKVKKLHPCLDKNISKIEDLHNRIAKLGRNTNSKSPGCVADSISVKNYSQLEKQTGKFYEEIRSLHKDVELISQNTGVSKEVIGQIKNHIFIDEHLLDTGISRFLPDTDMAAAWKRLMNNDFVQSDLLLLQHEYAESLIMNGTQVSWREAHDIVNSVYNWNKTL